MENMKLPLALVMAMAVQLAGGVWWVSQQAATITSLEDTVSQLGSRMAIEDTVNTKRDVEENKKNINDLADIVSDTEADLYEETDEIWEEIDSISLSIMRIVDLQQRVALLERTIEFLNRDHKDMFDPRG
jgi:vacuolar-type H+-ATPase subunit I/STV1